MNRTFFTGIKWPDLSVGLIVLCFAIIYFVWGATYLFVAWAVEEIPPFQMAGMRYLTAAFLMSLISLAFKQWRNLQRVEIWNALLAGFLFLGIGTGGVAWALQFVDTGLTALVISAEPLVIVLMMWGLDKQRPTKKTFIGVGLGILGVFLLVSQERIMMDPQQWTGLLAIFISITTWGYATIYVSRSKLPSSFMVSTALQMVSGGAATLIVSIFFETWIWDFYQLKTQTWISMAFLVILGGIVVFTAFNYLLKKVSPAKVATSTYVNPVIALVLGWWLRDELVSNQSILAAGIILSGVFFINSSK